MTSVDSRPQPVDSISVEERIVAATIDVIDQHGLVGLRVADVAKRADVTVAAIYRKFDDREGLLAGALGLYYDARYEQIIGIAERVLELPVITIDAIVDAVPPFRFKGSERTHQRMQRIYVAAVEFPALRQSLLDVAAVRIPQFDALIHAMVDRLPVGQKFDPRILSYMLPRHNALVDDVFGDLGYTDEEYKAFLRDTLLRSGRANARRSRE